MNIKFIASTSLFIGLTIANAASAITPILPAATVRGTLDISALAYGVSLTSPGTVSFGPPIVVPGAVPVKGCTQIPNTSDGLCDFGAGTISATLGRDPTISLRAVPANGGGGNSYLDMGYAFMKRYQCPSGQQCSLTQTITVGDSDILSASGLGGAVASMTVSGGPSGATIFSAYDCAGSSPGASGICDSPISPFGTKRVTINLNQIYFVQLELSVNVAGPVHAEIDPTFTGGGVGTFVFSPGITSAVPEPEAWTFMLAGFAGLGSTLRRRRRRLVC